MLVTLRLTSWLDIHLDDADQTVEPSLMMRWRTALTAPRGAGSSLQTWLWAPPAKRSSRQIEEMIERIECLYELRVHERMIDVPDDLLRRHARRLAGRPPQPER
jgi:hypothetical protein